MHYVKEFNINGVATKQVACIELQGPPNAATEGSIGVLGMDMSSPTHDVYRCVAVNGSIYTWEILSSGMSIISATVTGEGGESMSFPYTSLLLPKKYIMKSGDLILDSEGYLYQIDSIWADACDTTYTGTHIGSTGGKTCKLVVTDEGKLQLVTESGAVWSSVDWLLPDGDTIYRNPSNGDTSVIGLKTVDDTILKFFIGTQAEYEALGDAKNNPDTIYYITDDDTLEQLQNGSMVVGKALESGATSTIKIYDPNETDGSFPMVVSIPTIDNYKELCNTDITYNPKTKELSATKFVGALKGDVTGRADDAGYADIAGASDLIEVKRALTVSDGKMFNLVVPHEVNANHKYRRLLETPIRYYTESDKLCVTIFEGNVTGDVTGDVTGNVTGVLTPTKARYTLGVESNHIGDAAYAIEPGVYAVHFSSSTNKVYESGIMAVCTGATTKAPLGNNISVKWVITDGGNCELIPSDGSTQYKGTLKLYQLCKF